MRFDSRLAAAALAALFLSGAAGGDSPQTSEPSSRPVFRDVAADTGLSFVHDNGARGAFFLPEIMGSGGALFDYDDDGDLDVFLVQGAPLEQDGTASREPAGSKGQGRSGKAAGGTSRLFRNDLTRDASGRPVLRFTDVTDRAGVGFAGVGMGAATGDYDADGDLDLYVTAFGPSALYRNNGDGTFTDVTAASGASDARWATSAAFLDHDRDGDLDLFVANYVDFTVAGNKVCHDPVGARDYCAPSSYRPLPARFFRNDGEGRFSEATEAAGLTRAFGNGLGVSVGDYNGDGWLDLYVANDATPNQLWINRGDGTFIDEGLLSGSAVDAAGRPEGSMGIASGDFDEDGDEDLLVTNLTRESYVAYVNDGAGGFEDRRAQVGIGAPTADMTGFGTGWFDYDNDGRLDLFAANGAVNIIAALRGTPVPYRQRNQIFHNDGGGRLRDVSREAGPEFERADVGRGAAFGDIDNDGDVDVLVTSNGAAARLLLNETPRAAHGVSVRLRAASGNRWGFGARVGLVRKGQPTRWRRVGTDGSYLSARDPRVHVGLGPVRAIEALIVEWPDGVRETFTSLAPGASLTIDRGKGTRDADPRSPRL